ncbi:MAG: hypothetical protein ACOYJB_08120 [Christensenellaceae bacterium]|jgi:hypothetical protein
MKAGIENPKSELLKALQEKYQGDFDLSVGVNQSFQQLMKKILKIKGITTAEKFADATGLYERLYDSCTNEMVKNTKRPYKPAMRTLIAICISLDIDQPMTVVLLTSLGVTFSLTNEVHYAYNFLVSNFSTYYLAKESSLSEYFDGSNAINPEDKYEICNAFLKNLGIAEKHYLGVSCKRKAKTK